MSSFYGQTYLPAWLPGSTRHACCRFGCIAEWLIILLILGGLLASVVIIEDFPPFSFSKYSKIILTLLTVSLGTIIPTRQTFPLKSLSPQEVGSTVEPVGESLVNNLTGNWKLSSTLQIGFSKDP